MKNNKCYDETFINPFNSFQENNVYLITETKNNRSARKCCIKLIIVLAILIVIGVIAVMVIQFLL